MKIFRIVLLGLAMALFAMNFLTIDYQNLLASASLWAYFRIAIAFLIVVLLIGMIRKDRKLGKGK